MLLLRLIFMSSLVLACMLPLFIALFISCDTTYVRSKKSKTGMILVLALIIGGADFILYFMLHHAMMHKWNFIQTAKDIAHFRFSYQDVDLFPTALIICTVFSIVLGFVLRYILSLLQKSDIRHRTLPKRQKIGIYLNLSVIGLISILCYYFCFTGQQNIVINEVCANNQTIVLDNKGTISDYVELYNTGGLSCGLYKLYLSDDESNLKQMEIPFSVLPPNGYAVISLDTAAFSLKKEGGETLFLSDISGNILDQITIGATDMDYTYARQTDGGADWNILSCTPGATNADAFSWKSIPASPILSAESGFYAEDFDLTVSAEPGCTIYYTLDGSLPTADSLLYTEPIHVYDRSAEENVYRNIPNVTTEWVDNHVEPVDKAFIIRTVAISESGISSPLSTATYFVNLDQYRDNTVISLIAEPDDLFGEDGIYVTGQLYDDWYLGTQEGDAPETNYNHHGKAYEVPAYFEYLSKNLSFSQNIGLRIVGASSRNGVLKRFSLYAREEYSDSSIFDEYVFGVASHKLSLRGGYANSVYQALVQDRDVATQRYIRVSVFLNGEFWYNTTLIEVYDSRFFEERYGIRTDNIIVISQRAISEGLAEDRALYTDIYNFLDTHDMADASNYERFGEIIDIQSYIDYMCANIYIDNMDFTEVKNTVIWRSRDTSSSEYEDGRWRWAMYDLDASDWGDSGRWELSSQAEKNSFSLIPAATGGLAINQQRIFKTLKVNPAFCRQFVLTFMDLVNTNFTYDNAQKEMEIFGYNLTDYQGVYRDISYYSNFFRNRASYIVPYMAEEFDLTGTLETVTLSVNETSAGYIQLNTIKPDLSDGTWSGSYYTDYPVTATAVANKGYVFVGWKGITNSTEACVEVPVVEGGTKLYAIFSKEE